MFLRITALIVAFITATLLTFMGYEWITTGYGLNPFIAFPCALFMFVLPLALFMIEHTSHLHCIITQLDDFAEHGERYVEIAWQRQMQRAAAAEAGAKAQARVAYWAQQRVNKAKDVEAEMAKHNARTGIRIASEAL